MDENARQIAEMVRNGSYFEQSRAWYQAIYIGPVAERTFFLLVALLAGLVALVSVFAVMGFLPVVERPPLLMSTQRVEDTWLRIEPLKEKGYTLNEAMLRFYVRNYVEKRESYDKNRYAANYNFVIAQSDQPTAHAFMGDYSPQNPKSPAALLGTKGTQNITIHSLKIDTSAEPQEAVVRFSTQLDGFGQRPPTNWMAKLQFYYTDMVVATAIDAETGEESLHTQDPQFQVVHYELTEDK